MGRFYTREMGLLGLGGLALGVIIARLAGFGLVGTASTAIGGALALMLMVGPWLQEFLVGHYAESGNLPRALELAVKIRDSAPTRALRSRGSVDLALIQIQGGDPQNALRNLEEARLTDFHSPGARAVVQGHLAYCLALTAGDLKRAEELAREAATAVPEEGLFHFYLGLVRLKQGHGDEAEKLIGESFRLNPDASAPCPGERSYHLALVRKQLGRDFEADKGQAVKAGGKYAQQALEL